MASMWFQRFCCGKKQHECSAPGPAAAPRVLSTATAFPPNKYTQEDVLAAFLARHELTPNDAAWVQRVFRATDIKTCSYFLPKERLFEKMSRVQYVEYVRSGLFQLGLESAQKAIAQWSGDVQTITHIVWGTMTGTIHAPSMDTYLVRELGLCTNIKRLNVESMGCLTGFRCLALASELAIAKPGNIVLTIVCDIRSALGNQLTTHTPSAPVDRANVIASCLFHDSGGAAIVAMPQVPTAMLSASTMLKLRHHLSFTGPCATLTSIVAPTIAMTQLVEQLPQYDVINTCSLLVPDSEHEGESIHLYIAKELPEKVKEALPELVKDLLAPHNLTPIDCCFAVHTGGPKILEKIAVALGVSADYMQASWEVMSTQGNLSGSSNLVVLDHVRHMVGSGEGIYGTKQYCVCISIGPGVGIETILLRRA